MLILLEFYIRMLVLLEFAECNGFSLCEIWFMWFHAMILMKMKRIAMRVGKTLIDFEGEPKEKEQEECWSANCEKMIN